MFRYLRRTLQMAFAAVKERQGGALRGLIVHQDQVSPYTSGELCDRHAEEPGLYQLFAFGPQAITRSMSPSSEASRRNVVSKWSR